MDTIKAEYNFHLTSARASLAAAKSIRDKIVENDPVYAGPSQDHLETAVESAYMARTFAGVDLDLPASKNEFRGGSTKVGGRKTRDRIAGLSN